MAVAATTLKTHIRYLNHKVGVPHRQDALQHAQMLFILLGLGFLFFAG
ncbi:hypothetical protein ACVGWC_14275 [Enterobacter hormaechei]